MYQKVVRSKDGNLHLVEAFIDGEEDEDVIEGVTNAVVELEKIIGGTVKGYKVRFRDKKYTIEDVVYDNENCLVEYYLSL